jgi:hypothetical protein
MKACISHQNQAFIGHCENRIRFNIEAVATKGRYAATLVDKTRGEITVTAISFEDGILSYEYVPPKAQSKWGKKPGEKAEVSMVTWLKVTGDTFKGALMNGKDLSEINYDFSVTGQHK